MTHRLGDFKFSKVKWSELLDFWTLSIVRYSRNQKAQRFGNWICFHPQVGGETPTLLGPLERANLNHCTQQSRCLTPLTWGRWGGDTQLYWVPYKELTSIIEVGFRNVVFSSFSNTGRWTESKNPVILSIIHHHQNPLQFIRWKKVKLSL
jgi:hypothetical protein